MACTKNTTLALLNKLLAKSEMTQTDALEIGNKVKHGAAKKLGFI